jgi:hypothetical protein
MPDVLCLAKINDVFGHVGRVVSDAFEAFGNHHQVKAPANGGGVFDHALGQHVVDLLVDGVHFFVAGLLCRGG